MGSGIAAVAAVAAAAKVASAASAAIAASPVATSVVVTESLATLPPEIIYLTILVSFISCCCAILAGTFVIMLLQRLSKLFIKAGYNIPKRIVNRGCILICASYATAIFYSIRIGVILNTSRDFTPDQWLFFDLGVGFYMLIISTFIFSIFDQLKNLSNNIKIDKQKSTHKVIK